MADEEKPAPPPPEVPAKDKKDDDDDDDDDENKDGDKKPFYMTLFYMIFSCILTEYRKETREEKEKAEVSFITKEAYIYDFGHGFYS